MHRVLGLALVLWMLAGCGAEPVPTRDAVASAVAEARAVAATLTCIATEELAVRMPALDSTPDRVATGVALQQAIAATLTARVATPTRTPVWIPTQPPDAVATGVVVQRAIAATLTADVAPTTQTQDGSPSPTTTFTPSATVVPTGPPTATFTPILPACVSWLEAHSYIGSYQCICGIVSGTYNDPNSSAFFINFGYDRTGYYAVSFNLTLQGLDGRCIRICGTVETYNGRPQTIVNSPDQVHEEPVCP